MLINYKKKKSMVVACEQFKSVFDPTSPTISLFSTLKSLKVGLELQKL